MRRSASALPAACCAVATLAVLAGCSSDPVGGPQRAATHGYRARVTFKTDGLETASYEIAARGSLRRKGLGDGPALILDTEANKAWRVAADGKSASPVEFSDAEKEMPAGIPLTTGFDEK